MARSNAGETMVFTIFLSSPMRGTEHAAPRKARARQPRLATRDAGAQGQPRDRNGHSLAQQHRRRGRAGAGKCHPPHRE
eukprot:3358237-Prymnesium_polylepis.1